jgi:hypothetical protein
MLYPFVLLLFEIVPIVRCIQHSVVAQKKKHAQKFSRKERALHFLDFNIHLCTVRLFRGVACPLRPDLVHILTCRTPQAASLANSDDTIVILDDGEYLANLTAVAKNLTITGGGSVRPLVSFSTVPGWVISQIQQPNAITITGVDFQGAPATSAELIKIRESDVFLVESSITTTQEGSGVMIRAISSNTTLDRVRIPFLNGTLAVLSLRGSLTIIDSTWSRMFGFGISVTDSAFTLRNFAVRDSALSYIASVKTNATVVIENCRFSNISVLRAFAFSPVGLLSIANCSFENIRGTYSSPLFAIRPDSDSMIVIADSNFTDIRLLAPAAPFDAAISINTLGREVLIDRCRFSNTPSTLHTIGALVVYNLDSPAFPAVEGRTVIRNSFFGSLSAQNGGAIFAQGVRSLTIQGCKFENNTATEAGGALRISYSSRTTTTLSLAVSDSEFIQNRVRSSSLLNSYGKAFVASGGAIAVDGPLESVTIQRCQFVENQVVSTSGWANGGALQIGAFYRISNVTLTQNLFVNNTASGWEPATGGAFAISGLFGLETQSNVFVYNGASLSAPQPFFDPERRLAFGGGAFIAGFSGMQKENYVIMKDDIFSANAAGQGGALHLQEVSVILNGSSFRRNYAVAATGGVLFMYSQVYQHLPTDLANMTDVVFDGNMIVTPEEAVRYSNCSVRGVQSQQDIRIRCLNCSESSFLGSDVAAAGGKLFLLASPSSAFPVLKISPNNVPFGGISGIEPMAIVIPTSSLDGLTAAFPLAASSFASNVQRGSCENLLTQATLSQPGWDGSSSTCIWDSSRQVLTIRAVVTLSWICSVRLHVCQLFWARYYHCTSANLSSSWCTVRGSRVASGDFGSLRGFSCVQLRIIHSRCIPKSFRVACSRLQCG